MITKITKFKKYQSILENNNIENASAVILIKDNKILVLQRGNTAPWMPNKWNLPGGIVDHGETTEQAAIRECIEECEIIPENIKELSYHDNGDWTIKFYYTYNFQGNAIISDESQDFKWIEFSDINKLEFVPYVKEAIIKCFELNKNT